MKPSRPDFSHLGFVKTFVLPALWVFLIPVLSLLFFLHAQATYDAQARENFLAGVRADAGLSKEDREAATEFFSRVPLSQMLLDERIALGIDERTRFDYATFRWMIRIAWASIFGGLSVFLLAGVCVLISFRSQLAQYLCLLIGWQILRIYSAIQTIAFGVLLVALSFWVTALWFKVYYPQLIFIAGALALVAVFAVLVAIFKKPKYEFVVEGTLLPKDEGSPLWRDLQAICAQVGTAPPDQIIAGIDDNFFVTENPVTVEGKQHTGRTLFISLALLKHLNAAEAEAVLAHEMAHFSGNDTLYSRRIQPLMQRYESHLAALYENPLTKPAFYLLLCFHALFGLSLSRQSRQREFRADRIAQEATSARDFAGAMLRIAAYSNFRTSIEQELFSQEEALVTADVSDRIAQGFPAYALSFAADPKLGESETMHPFDSHPPMSQRLAALGISSSAEEIRSILSTTGDGRWYDNVPAASELERAQWLEFEDRFRDYHEATLPYRFLPATPEELAVVQRMFPPLTIEGPEGAISIDHEKVLHAPWPDAIHFSEITQWTLSEDGTLKIESNRAGKKSRLIKLNKFGQPKQQEIIDALQRYYGRYLAAIEYQKYKVMAEQSTRVNG